MAGYSATMIVMGLTGKPISASGSFGNINLDGRMSILTAAEVAREIFKRECTLKNQEYLGFALEKTSRFVDYKNPSMFDTELQAKDVAFLL